MAKKRKPEWEKKPCGCVKTELQGERVMIRCSRHAGKPSKRTLLHFGESTIVARDQV